MMRISRWFLSLLILILLPACNLPTSKKATPTVDFIATTVAETLVALPSKTPPSTQSAGPTAAQSAATQPANETPTSTASPSPTPPGDPKSWLGTPTKLDTLDNPQGFGLAGGYEDDAAKIVVSDGAMIMTSFSTVGWRTWRVRPPELSNAYLDAAFRTVNCTASDQYGLVFRAPNYDTGYGYYFGVTCDGRYSFSRWDANGTSALVNLTPDTNILSGPGQTNRLGVMAKGQNIKLYINGNSVKEIEDAGMASGFFGAFIGGFSGNFTVQMEEIAYWLNP